MMPPLVVLCGPTAIGKTAAALELASHFNCEVVSADSRQVYRLMDVGTAKPSAGELARLPHHLINVVWPDEPFDAARFATAAATAVASILTRGKIPLLVGGTGLYIRALTEGLVPVPGADPDLRRQFEDEAAKKGSAVLHQRLMDVDPAAAGQLHPNDTVRIIRALEVFVQTGRRLSDWQEEHGFRSRRYRLLKIGLTADRDLLYRRIDERSAAMFSGGLLEETEDLLARGYAPELKAMQTIGYREAVKVLRGEITRDQALADLQQSTRRYAKRQLTWFRADPEMIWVDSVADSAKLRKLIWQFYEA